MNWDSCPCRLFFCSFRLLLLYSLLRMMNSILYTEYFGISSCDKNGANHNALWKPCARILSVERVVGDQALLIAMSKPSSRLKVPCDTLHLCFTWSQISHLSTMNSFLDGNLCNIFENPRFTVSDNRVLWWTYEYDSLWVCSEPDRLELSLSVYRSIYHKAIDAYIQSCGCIELSSPSIKVLNSLRFGYNWNRRDHNDCPLK